MKPLFKTRGLEVHSAENIWNETKIDQALDFMEKYQLNTLIFHDSDLSPRITFQSEYSGSADFRKFHRNRGMLKIVPIWISREYLNHVIAKAAARKIKVMIEIKEICFPDEFPDKFGLRKNGKDICASDPIWWRYLTDKTKEICSALPDLAGIIVSPASWESKLSISETGCDCSSCRSITPKLWYKELINAMYYPLHQAGKLLVVRDFSYNPEEQAPLLEAIAESPADVVASLKVTPHDFYATFPNNAAISAPCLNEREKWVEYDVWGQFCGWSIVPAYMMDDIDYRMRHALDYGVNGFYARTDWEMIRDAWCLGSINEIYFKALARFGVEGPKAAFQEVEMQMEKQASEYEVKDKDHYISFLKRTWEILKRSLYVKGHVINQSSLLPLSLETAWWHMDVHDNLWKWDPSTQIYLEKNDSVLKEVLAEKDAVIGDLNYIRSSVKNENEYFRNLVEQFCAYTEMFCHAAKAIYMVKMEGPDIPWRQSARMEIEAMVQSSAKLQQYKPARYYGKTLFAHWRTEMLAKDLNWLI